MVYQVTTTNPKRSRLWDRIFNTEALPVSQGKPRLVRDPAGDYYGYDLLISALHPMQIARLAAWAAEETGQPYAIIHQMILDVGFVIRADETEVTAVQEETAVSFFLAWQAVGGSLWAKRSKELGQTVPIF